MEKEILTPEVIEELPLEKVIENTLVKNNVTDKVINALKKQYGGMQLKSLTDKQGYLEIKEARNNVRKVGIMTEKLCKAGRDDANKIRGMWIDKEKEVLGKIAEVQDPLDAQIKQFEDEEARIRELEIQRQEEQFMKRQTTLLKMEAVYSGNSFTLGAVSYELDNIKEADEEIWTDTILPKYQREFDKVENEKADIEKHKKEAEEKLKAEQAELVRQQEELNKQREEIRLQQEELQKQKLESERVQREIVEKDRIAKSQQEEKIWRGRLSELDDIKWNGQFAFRDDENDPVIAYKDLIEYDDEAFGIIRDLHNNVVSERKESKRIIDQEKRKLELEQAQQDAASKERERIEEEQRQTEIKRKQEEQRQLEESAKASDKEKWGVLLSALNSISLPQFTSTIYKGKLAVLKEKFEEINSL